LLANQLQLTIADIVDEAHDTHHPIASSLYYEDQKPEALSRSADFLESRVPKYLGYFERVLAGNGKGQTLVGARLSYPDLSLFQVVEGLKYAFPKAAAPLLRRHPKVRALAERVAERPRIKAYLASQRRIPFNEHGIFRHYPELDGAA
ncbi:MAG: glutathione S-transferase family protein, partial [Acetobacteraceae bacterium]|nr:glutathione S-transferase family protein [Acetobacteraceae bacterium]